MGASGAEGEVRAVIDQLVEAQNAGDVERFSAVVSMRPEGMHIGTGPEEWWTSQQLIDEIGGIVPDIMIEDVLDDVTVHVEGENVAWVVGRGRFKGSGGKERPTRMSAVLVREGGEWKLLQSHSSIAVPNSEIFRQ